ncbi:uncharacterized protein LOC143545440 [Bidens hawaiensis]|uniref:uncharacterized protein LOC143545440 n=1 Tax=Bidens hawaiensis TaxID=980011 RepID=UPI00404A3A26
MNSNSNNQRLRKLNQPLPPSSSKLLAGYMAHEFRTRGTVLGRRFDGEKVGPVTESSYKEVTNLMMLASNSNDGAGACVLPGVVNPTQLARWIQM